MSELPEVHAVGDRALLVELENNAAAQAFAEAARTEWGSQLTEVVPGHQTVLLASDQPRINADDVISFLKQFARTANRYRNESAAAATTEVTIPAVYDGADLEAVAERIGVDPERVVELHAAAQYVVAFVGFMPGFPYLIGGDPLLDLPRLETPRTEVPAGSVAVAAGYCGIYPKAAPGGWNLLGRTEVQLFDVSRDPPALLAPGTRVRFEAVGG